MKNLTHVNSKLLELDDQFASVYPKFKKIELEYISKYDKMLMTAANNYGSQALRDGAVRQQMITEENELWTNYNTMAVEIKVIEVRLRNLQQISRNMISQNFTGE